MNSTTSDYSRTANGITSYSTTRFFRRPRQLAFLITILIVLFSVRAVTAQNTQPCLNVTKFEDFFSCEITLFLNQRDRTKQVEVPSIAGNTTSLTDNPASSDIAGLALNFLGQQTKTDSGKDTAGTVTLSAYWLYALINGKDPKDPVFYNSHRNFRRVSFTVGQDPGNDTSKPARIFGTKIMLLDHRDASRPTNQKLLAQAYNNSALRSSAFKNADLEIKIYLYNLYAAKNQLPSYEASLIGIQAVAFQTEFNRIFTTSNQEFQSTIAGLTEDQQKTVRARVLRIIDDKTIYKELETAVIAGNSEAPAALFRKVRGKPQLSLTFQSKLRNGNNPDEYRAGLLFDYIVADRVNLTLNGTYDYKKSHIIGGDQKSGRFAIDGNFQLSENKALAPAKNPFTLSISGEGKWMNAVKPTITGQAKLTIPLYDGISFPISVSYGNRPDLIQGNYIRGNFGLTFDLGKLIAERMKDR